MAADFSVNPFTPTFGQIPPVMAGRSEIIGEVVRAFERGMGDPNLVSLLVGARGSGKTALLTYLADEALSRGWVTASVSAVPGMLEDIEERALVAAGEFVETPDRMRLRGFNVGQLLGVEWESREAPPGNWRTRMAEHDVGLLIVVDEVRVDLEDMIQLASVYQHFVREGRKVALLMAGLPSKVSALLRDDSVSFLRRASYHQLGRVDDGAVRDALRKTVEAGGRSIESSALDCAVRAIEGFPYMMQLVGYRMWDEISAQDVVRGTEYAERDIERKILETTYRELSRGDLRFLYAMLEDEGVESSTRDIGARLGKKANYVSQYKRRLLAQGVLEDRGHGMVSIAIPRFRDYLNRRRG